MHESYDQHLHDLLAKHWEVKDLDEYGTGYKPQHDQAHVVIPPRTHQHGYPVEEHETGYEARYRAESDQS